MHLINISVIFNSFKHLSIPQKCSTKLFMLNDTDMWDGSMVLWYNKIWIGMLRVGQPLLNSVS